MGDMTGFLKHEREMPTRRPVPVRLRDWKEVYEAVPRRAPADAGGAVHGLRHPVLQQRLPARQPHPRLERPRLPRPLARRHRAAARHQQLPGVHRPALPGAVRGGVRARHQPGPGHDQAGRGRDHRPRVGRGLGRAACRRRPPPASGGRGRLRARRPGRRPAAHPRRPRRRRVRAGRPHRRAAALRHPRVQDGEAPPRPPPRADGGRGHRVPHRRRRRRRRHRRRAARRVRRDRARRRRHRVARPADPRAASSTASTRRWSTCRWSNQVQEGDLPDDVPITPTASTWSSSAAATPAPTASAPPTARARASVHQFEIMPRPPDAGPTRTRGRPGR